jgi:ABC-type multidrug transport system ATPase subunit
MLRSGEVVADGNPLQLISQASAAATLSIVIGGTFDPAPLLGAGAIAQKPEGDYQRFTAADPQAATLALGKILQTPGVILADLQMKRPSLEDVYLRLMGDVPPENEVAS